MADLTIVGFGPGPWAQLTLEVRDLLLAADRIYVRDPFWEVCRRLEQAGKRVIGLHHLYLTGLDGPRLYPFMAELLVRSCQLHGPLVYALPGNPFVFEYSAGLVLEKARAQGLSVRVVEGMSCLESMFCHHQVDPGRGLQILNFLDFARHGALSARVPALLFQVGAPLGGTFDQAGIGYRTNLRVLEQHLGRHYRPGHAVALFKPGADCRQLRVEGRVGELLALEDEMTMYSTLFVPAAGGAL